MKDKLRDLEIEVAYLRREILRLIDVMSNVDFENHMHYTNIFLGEEYLDNLTEDYDIGE